jgi:pimeloyl-ACP methyl ester carboxylesterase
MRVAEVHSTAPRRRAAEVARAFMTPRAPRNPQHLKLTGGVTARIATSEGEVAVQYAGVGPPVLLLHGWEGQASDLQAFAAPLMTAGYSVLAPDLPGHGESDGALSSIPQAARALCGVAKFLRPLHGAIAHSVGSAVLVEALFAGLSVQRAVLISAPAHYEACARGFAAAAGLGAAETEAMLSLVRAATGVDVREVSMPRRAPHLHQPALFIHSSDDPVVAIGDSLTSAAAWPGARHLRVKGLGHRRILADRGAVSAAVEFIASAVSS